jgi:1-acyl-sn-glycerol-3-phosphate acyltransferase
MLNSDLIKMKLILDYILSAIYILYFGIIIVIFHPIQIFCYHIFGPKAQQKSVHVLNFFLLYGLYITGASMRFNCSKPLPTDRPLILVANHQSMFDIIGMIWFLRRNFPVFVSKIELSKGVPSISYNLRKSGAALINRKDSKQAVGEILRLSGFIQEKKYAAVIFPEGTRSRNGHLKSFAPGGLATLLKKAPDALIVPVAIEGTGKLNPKSIFPLCTFTKLTWTILPTIEPKGKTVDELVSQLEGMIKDVVVKE